MTEPQKVSFLDTYLPISFDERGESNELGIIFRHASELAPNKLRVKEIIEPAAWGYYTRALECCAHCGALGGGGERRAAPAGADARPLWRCTGCDSVSFCRPCRHLAHRRGHAVAAAVGFGRACVASRARVGTLGVDSYGAPTITFDADGKGRRVTKCVAIDAGDGDDDALAWPRGRRALFQSNDAVMVLAYSVIMLTTNLHNANVKEKEKMQLHEFISQCRGINDGTNFPGDYLADIYDNIASEELQVMRPLDTQPRNSK